MVDKDISDCNFCYTRFGIFRNHTNDTRKEMIKMNIKQTAKEATISDSTFIFPIVDGLGRPVENLRLIRNIVLSGVLAIVY